MVGQIFVVIVAILVGVAVSRADTIAVPASCLELAVREGVVPTSLADARRQVTALVRTGDALARRCKSEYDGARPRSKRHGVRR